MRIRNGLMGAALAVSGFWAEAASACGGFFCDNAQPVEQAGEQIVFAVDGTTVTTIVQVQYQGPSEAFSWVLPVPSVPKVGVSTDALFTQLRATTDPRFQMVFMPGAGGCRAAGCNFGTDASDATDGADGFDGMDGTDATDSGIDILDQGAVGPYDYTVIEADTGELLYDWLDENGYDTPPQAKPEIIHYVNQKFVFVAVKLQKLYDAGSVVPIKLTYESDTFACVPLRLTSIAAAPDMPVRAWILADARAIPMNYFHGTVNARAIPWQACGNGAPSWGCDQAYWNLVAAASDAGEGHTFVTEFAGKVAGLKAELPVFDLSSLAEQPTAEWFFQAVGWQGYAQNPAVLETYRALMPMKDGAPGDCAIPSSFYGPLFDECRSYHLPPEFVFDSAAVASALEEAVNEAALDVNALLAAHSYVTRLYTRISPEEMTMDPLFSFNPDLPDVSNVHQLRLTPECDGESNDAVRYKTEWPNGEVDLMPIGQCGEPLFPNASAQPALGQLQILGESGPAENITSADVPKRIGALELRSPSAGQSEKAQTATARAAGVDRRSGTMGLAPRVDDGGGSDGVDGNDGVEAFDGNDGRDGSVGVDGIDGNDSDGGSGDGAESDDGSTASKDGTAGCTAGDSGKGVVPLLLGLLAVILTGRRRRSTP
ncbi:MAG: DUF2330 domain-containing protein [Myxococcales bacterium]|nr:DUF2330 domain-containing protein [Myxococcales bacterium]